MNVPAAQRRVSLVVPDLGLGDAAVTVSLWLVPKGRVVQAGERVVELVSGAATIDLGAPVTGRLVVQLVDEDDPVAVGVALAEFEVVE